MQVYGCAGCVGHQFGFQSARQQAAPRACRCHSAHLIPHIHPVVSVNMQYTEIEGILGGLKLENSAMETWTFRDWTPDAMQKA